MNAQFKAGVALSILFMIGFFSGWMFNHLTDSSAVRENSELLTPRHQTGPPPGERPGNLPREERLQRFDRDSGNIPSGENRRAIINRMIDVLDISSDEEKRLFRDLLIQYRNDVGAFIRETRDYEMAEIQKRYDTLQVDLSQFLNDDQLRRLDRFIQPETNRNGLYQGRRPMRNPESGARGPGSNQRPEPRP
ncbi:MAG: hypothetical protein DA443_04050 [Bacteroidetes bacterium]|jgi:hypothetical protein|nr:hypothetical protein [Bacteroidota bacterium]PTM15214.1 MAG: hypothetical protein DA443_04050 [Bacteroidota bacterium]